MLASLGTRISSTEERKGRLLKLVLDSICRYTFLQENQDLNISPQACFHQWPKTSDPGQRACSDTDCSLRYNLKFLNENMSLEREVVGFVAHGPISIHHCDYIHMEGVGGWFLSSFLQARQVTTMGFFCGGRGAHLMANSHPLNSLFQLKIIIKFKSIKHS